MAQPRGGAGWFVAGVVAAEIVLSVVAWKYFGTGALFRVAIALSCVTAYAMLLGFVRWHHIAVPFRRHLFAEVQGLRADLKQYTSAGFEGPVDAAAKASVGDAIKCLLDKAEAVAREGVREPEAEEEHCGAKLADTGKAKGHWIWTRGLELAGWHMLLDARPKFAWLMPRAEAAVRLRSSTSSIRALGAAGAAIADQGDAELKKDRPEESVVQALLFEALRLESEEEKEEDVSLLTWHNKVLFLLLISLGMIVGAAGLGCAVLLVFGAIGGLVSRLLRGLEGESGAVPSRFSTYWTSFFLSPVVGALGGWLAVPLVAFLVQVGVLGTALMPFAQGADSLACLDGAQLYLIKAGAIAFLAGFSERLLQQLVASSESKFAGDRESRGESAS